MLIQPLSAQTGADNPVGLPNHVDVLKVDRRSSKLESDHLYGSSMGVSKAFASNSLILRLLSLSFSGCRSVADVGGGRNDEPETFDSSLAAAIASDMISKMILLLCHEDRRSRPGRCGNSMSFAFAAIGKEMKTVCKKIHEKMDVRGLEMRC